MRHKSIYESQIEFLSKNFLISIEFLIKKFLI